MEVGSCEPTWGGDTQRTRLWHLRMVGSEWLTNIPILVTYCYNSFVGIVLNYGYISIWLEKEKRKSL